MSSDVVSIRPATGDDLPHLEVIAQRTQMFLEEELAWFSKQMAAFFAGELPDQHWWVATIGDRVVGAALLDPEGAPGVANLRFIGVLPDCRRRGAAQMLLRRAEAQGRADGARLILIDTSSLEKFAPAHALYLGLGYDAEARIRDYWNPGDDKVTFRKALGA